MMSEMSVYKDYNLLKMGVSKVSKFNYKSKGLHLLLDVEGKPLRLNIYSVENTLLFTPILNEVFKEITNNTNYSDFATAGDYYLKIAKDFIGAFKANEPEHINPIGYVDELRLVDERLVGDVYIKSCYLDQINLDATHVIRLGTLHGVDDYVPVHFILREKYDDE